MPLPTTITTDELNARLAFWRISGVGPKLMGECMRQFSSIRSLFECTQDLPPKLRQLLKKADWYGAEQDLKWLMHSDHFLLLQGDDQFPDLLTEIADAPPFVFVRGNVSCLTQTQLALVGSRNPSHYGLKAAQLLTEQLAQAGFVITSGLALGIDAAVHQSALVAGGQTLAVLAIGLDAVYPKRHQKLAEEICAQSGALVSEFGVGTQPLPENFPRRNRLISGLSLGVVVIEATLKSGSLITARYALDQGREVFAVPGSIFQPLASGCHALIKQGAKCIEQVADILSELRCEMIKEEKRLPIEKALQTSCMLRGVQKELLNLLSEVPQSFELLLEQVSWPIGTLQAILSELTVQGLAEHTWYGYVRLK